MRRELRILRRLCERLGNNGLCRFRKTGKIDGGVRGKKKKLRRLAHQIPPFFLDRIRLAPRDEGPHKLGHTRARVQLKVERHLVFGRVEEVDEAPAELEGELEEIVARSEREDGVQGGDGRSTRGERKEIAVSVRGEVDAVAPGRRWTRELLFEDVHVRAQPVVCIHATSMFWYNAHAQPTPILSAMDRTTNKRGGE